MNHWSSYLVTGFSFDHEEPVTINVNAGTDHGGMVTVASRIKGIYDALKTHQGETRADDKLAHESTEDLLDLLDHVHRVIGDLIAQEDRVIDVLRHQGVASRRVAAAMDVDHKTVLNRHKRIDKAAAHGLNTRGYQEKMEAEL